MTLSAPKTANSSARPFTSEPINTAVTSVSKSFAKSFAFPSNSNATPSNTLSTCCAKTYTPLYSSKPIVFTTFPYFYLDNMFLFKLAHQVSYCFFCIKHNFLSCTFTNFVRCFCNLCRRTFQTKVCIIYIF